MTPAQLNFLRYADAVTKKDREASRHYGKKIKQYDRMFRAVADLGFVDVIRTEREYPRLPILQITITAAGSAFLASGKIS